MRSAALAVFAVSACFSTPVRPAGDTDATTLDARTCPTVDDDFEDPSGPACGTWGAPQNVAGGTLMRTGTALQTFVGAGGGAGCLGIAMDLNDHVWLQIDVSQAPMDDVVFDLQLGTRSLGVTIYNNNSPVYQGRVSSSSIIGDLTSKVYSPDVMKFWRFRRVRSEDTSTHKSVNLEYSTTGDPNSYLVAIHYGVSGPEPMSVTPTFRVIGATGSPANHASAVFDNFNAPCTPGI